MKTAALVLVGLVAFAGAAEAKGFRFKFSSGRGGDAPAASQRATKAGDSKSDASPVHGYAYRPRSSDRKEEGRGEAGNEPLSAERASKNLQLQRASANAEPVQAAPAVLRPANGCGKQLEVLNPRPGESRCVGKVD
jgi:hypothetical protein